jgi:hypothetical protein
MFDQAGTFYDNHSSTPADIAQGIAGLFERMQPLSHAGHAVLRFEPRACLYYLDKELRFVGRSNDYYISAERVRRFERFSELIPDLGLKTVSWVHSCLYIRTGAAPFLISVAFGKTEGRLPHQFNLAWDEQSRVLY